MAKAATPPKPNFPVLQMLALKIHLWAFFYLPKFPLKFNRDFTKIEISQSPWQWIFVAILLAHLFSQGIISGLLALYFGKFQKSEKEFGWERLVLLVLVSIIFTGSTLLEYSVLKARNRIISSFNELLKIKRALTLSGDIQENKKDSDQYGYAMLTTAVLSGGFPFVFTLSALFMNYDVSDYIFKIVLNDPMYWDGKTVYCTIVLRTIILFTSGLEISRSGGYFLCCLFIFGDQGSKVVECLKNLRFSIFVYLYTSLQIMHQKILNWLHWFIYLLHATFFWGTVVSSYFVIVCWEKVSLVIYIGAIIGVLVCVLIQVTLLPHCVDTIVLTKNIVEIQKTNVKILRAQQKRYVNLKNLKVVMGIRPINILCGSFKVIDREFLTEHFELLMTRVFDAILIS